MPTPGVDQPRVTVYDARFREVGDVVLPERVVVHDVFNAPGGLEVGVSGELDSEIAAELENPGARAVVTFRDTVVFSGRRARIAWAGPSRHPTATVTFVGDYQVLGGLLSYPVPSVSLASAAKFAAESWTYQGPLESACKALISANVGRLAPLAVTIEPDAGRGSAVTVTTRMKPLTDELKPLLDAQHAGVRVAQSGSGLLVSYVPPVQYPGTLSDDTETIGEDWTLEETDAEATTVVAAGQGEGAARVFYQERDAELETQVGTRRETFLDARDLPGEADIRGRARTELTDKGTRVSARVPLAETEGFHCYGLDGVTPGARVYLELAGRSWWDTVTDVTISWTPEDGLVVAPVVGGLESVTTRRDRSRLARIQQRIRRLETR